MKFVIDYEKEKELLFDFIKNKKTAIVFEAYKNQIETVPLSNDNEFIAKQLQFIEQYWNSVAENYYLKIGNFFEINAAEPEIICYLTRFDVFPYNYGNEKKSKWFTAPLFGNPLDRNRVIMHELCHFFQPKKLPRPIKEAIPVILNDHENFLMFGNEKGHQEEEEQKWRKIIWDLYNK